MAKARGKAAYAGHRREWLAKNRRTGKNKPRFIRRLRATACQAAREADRIQAGPFLCFFLWARQRKKPPEALKSTHYRGPLGQRQEPICPFCCAQKGPKSADLNARIAASTVLGRGRRTNSLSLKRMLPTSKSLLDNTSARRFLRSRAHAAMHGHHAKRGRVPEISRLARLWR